MAVKTNVNKAYDRVEWGMGIFGEPYAEDGFFTEMDLLDYAMCEFSLIPYTT